MVKLIHTADLHLDSRLSALGDSEKACVRRDELTKGFFELLSWAEQNGVNGILVAGDLFESGNVSPKIKRDLISAFNKYPEITFFLLGGNHDAAAFDADFTENLPQNVKTFGKDGDMYLLDNVAIYGKEADFTFSAADLPLFEANRVNIVVLHGSWEPVGNDVYINIKKCAGRAIDYLALGHFHDYAQRQIDARGVACYSGCLQGRGFDECGTKGFVLIEIDGRNIKHTFKEFGKRRFYLRKADVTGCQSYFEVLQRVQATVQDISADCGVKIEICGEVQEGRSVETERLRHDLAERFFTVRVSDGTRTVFDTKTAANELSLKNEFKRIVGAMDIDESSKQEVLRLGLSALNGEELR